MFFDVYSFKGFNDTLGQETCDLLLKEVARNMKKHLRENVVIARFGGDEFLKLMRNINNYYDVINIAEQIISSMQTPFTINQW
ncbi:diguanylate cyclase/phosphodiesterase, partial [Pseudoalteromonas sp. S327]|uniref:diguanylate cyclase domain-containing protein n=1 Tax=Pseudoalteromonas sp. S327 TaxID=579535 RepID=UPI00110B8136